MRRLCQVSLPILAGLAICLVGPSFARADVIELTTGQRLEGDVLKDGETEIVVDLGVSLVRIPVSQIKSREKKRGANGQPTPSVKVTSQDVFATADLPTRSVKELARQFGEGVVLVQTPSGLGSGFIINDRGMAVTNHHVIEHETRLAVTIFQKSEQGELVRRRIDEVQILATNPFFDLALIQIPKQSDLSFKPVFLAKKNEVREGDEVFAIGNPLGLERSVSQGIVSTRNRNFGGLTYIQMTAEINPGNSGGPLFNLQGEVVGVTNMKLAVGEGLGFAIPVAYVKHFLDNRDAFAFDKNNPNTGFRYLDPPRRKLFGTPPESAKARETKSASKP